MSRCSILQTSVSTTNRSARLASTWFTDKKIFTVQTPTNSQNDQVYTNVAMKRDIPSERLLKGRKHLSHSIMVSVAHLSWVYLHYFLLNKEQTLTVPITVASSYIKDYCQ